ncbi:MAG: hypothetical protein FWC91_13115, partial [Defluviitaleaceae bacterium]|nr:hypothetical protein [Defluviitaleaceae bacterium]
MDKAVMSALKMHLDLLIEMGSIVESLVNSKAYNSCITELLHEKAGWETEERNADKTLSAAYTHLLDGLLDYKEYGIIRTKVDEDKK